MKKLLALLVAVVFIFVFCSPTFAGWNERIAKNQVKAIDYILKLKAGADPREIERPKLRRDEKARAAKANREIREAMAKAEKLAQSGKHSKIRIPDFKTKLVSDKRFKSLQREHQRKSS